MSTTPNLYPIQMLTHILSQGRLEDEEACVEPSPRRTQALNSSSHIEGNGVGLLDLESLSFGSNRVCVLIVTSINSPSPFLLSLLIAIGMGENEDCRTRERLGTRLAMLCIDPTVPPPLRLQTNHQYTLTLTREGKNPRKSTTRKYLPHPHQSPSHSRRRGTHRWPAH